MRNFSESGNDLGLSLRKVFHPRQRDFSRQGSAFGKYFFLSFCSQHLRHDRSRCNVE